MKEKLLPFAVIVTVTLSLSVVTAYGLAFVPSQQQTFTGQGNLHPVEDDKCQNLMQTYYGVLYCEEVSQYLTDIGMPGMLNSVIASSDRWNALAGYSGYS
jgi:hypothetical protein